MLIGLTIEEIETFPDEVKNFLLTYISGQLPQNKTVQASQPESARPESTDSDALKIDWDYVDRTPTRYQHKRRLIAGHFDWEQMMRVEIMGLYNDVYNDIKIHCAEGRFHVNWDVGRSEIDHSDPKTWGFCIILCALFGFGGTVPGFTPARHPKGLCKNLEKLGISGGRPIQPRSAGPLLKSITKLVQQWHLKFCNGGPVPDLHWFDFDKRGHFYFAGTTFDDCYEAVKNISQQFFIARSE